MRRAMTQSIMGVLSGTALVLGLSVSELGAQPATNFGQPFGDIQATLGIILDRLADLEGKLDDQPMHTTDLRGVTQNWDKKLDATNGEANGCNSDRFTCLFGDTVVRDNETGLVWERDPDANFRTWINAITHCANREVGGRKGWQLPLREQLATLVDGSNADPALPTVHPFLNVQSFFYWSATTSASGPMNAWDVLFFNGEVNTGTKDSGRYAWCVRGGQGFDGNTHNTLH